MEGLDLTLGFSQNDRGRERFTDGLALDLSGQAVVRTVRMRVRIADRCSSSVTMEFD